jgi:hypothetical protein
MSGWQRIGAVISILWLVGFPIFLFIDANRSHSEVLQYCLKAASASREPTEREESRQICLRAFEASRETPGFAVAIRVKRTWTVALQMFASRVNGHNNKSPEPSNSLKYSGHDQS